MNIEFVRLNHVQVSIPPGQEDSARRFYRDILGLREIEKPAELRPNGGLWFQIADVQLHIGIENVEAGSKRHPAFEVKDLPGIRSYLETHGVKIKSEIQLPGIGRLSFFDPFGNRIELMEMRSVECGTRSSE